MSRVEFTLDNLIYELDVRSSEDLQLVLPKKTCIRPLDYDGKKNYLSGADAIKFVVYLKMFADPVPEVTIVSRNEDVKIEKHGSFVYEQGSTNVISFITTDGGNSWLVKSSSTDDLTSAELEDLVKTAQQSANNAQSSANAAQTSADNAQITADNAQETADQAVTDAATAQKAADNAQTAANEAVSSAATAQSTADVAQNTASEAVNSAATAQETADKAVIDAENAQKTADQAVTDAATAQTTADNAQVDIDTLDKETVKLQSDTTQTINSDLVIGNGKKLYVQTADGDTPSGLFVKTYDTGLTQFELGSQKLSMCLNHSGTTEGEVIDKHIKVDCKETPDGETFHEKIAYMSDLDDKVTNDQLNTTLADYAKLNGLNDSLISTTGYYINSTKEGSITNSGALYLGENSNLILGNVNAFDLQLNHKASTDKHVAVNYYNSDSVIEEDKLAYMSDLENKVTTEELESSIDTAIKLDSDQTQIINSDLTISSGHKTFVQDSATHEYNALSLMEYDTGISQIEIGSASMPLCLNHSGATSTDGSDVIDKHIKVDCREDAESPILHESIAYLSDLSNYVTTDAISNMATTSDLDNYISKEDVSTKGITAAKISLENSSNEEINLGMLIDGDSGEKVLSIGGYQVGNTPQTLELSLGHNSSVESDDDHVLVSTYDMNNQSTEVKKLAYTDEIPDVNNITSDVSIDGNLSVSSNLTVDSTISTLTVSANDYDITNLKTDSNKYHVFEHSASNNAIIVNGGANIDIGSNIPVENANLLPLHFMTKADADDDQHIGVSKFSSDGIYSADKLAYVSDIPDTSDFITSTNLTSGIDTINVDNITITGNMNLPTVEVSLVENEYTTNLALNNVFVTKIGNFLLVTFRIVNNSTSDNVTIPINTVMLQFTNVTFENAGYVTAYNNSSFIPTVGSNTLYVNNNELVINANGGASRSMGMLVIQ